MVATAHDINGQKCFVLPTKLEPYKEGVIRVLMHPEKHYPIGVYTDEGKVAEAAATCSDTVMQYSQFNLDGPPRINETVEPIPLYCLDVSSDD